MSAGFYDMLVAATLWLTALHIIAVLFWLAGLFYLPRLYAYHAEWLQEEAPPTKGHEYFTRMERRLLHIIMWPSLGAAWLFGLLLLIRPGFWADSGGWLDLKLALVVVLSLYQFWLAALRPAFAAGKAPLRARTLRGLNEIGPVLAALIVLLAVLKFF